MKKTIRLKSDPEEEIEVNIDFKISGKYRRQTLESEEENPELEIRSIKDEAGTEINESEIVDFESLCEKLYEIAEEARLGL